MGTASAETGAKLAGYFQVPSIAHYLIVHPTKRVVTHHRRSGNGIETRILVGGAIDLDPPGIQISVEEIYEAA
jgi:Uma2 family endonuclease